MAGGVVLGCTADPPSRDEGAGVEAPAAIAGWASKTLAWGSGPANVGLRPEATERPAEGPSSIAVGKGGEVLVLDRLNERVLAISGGGDVRTRAEVARDAEHVSVGRGGEVAAYSPLRATVWLHGRGGAALGEIEVPRVLRDVMRVDVGESHRLFAVTAMQETWSLGSPGAPLDLSSTLRTRREGAAFLADGRGVAGRKTESGAEILVYRAPAKDGLKVTVGATWPLEGPVSSIRVVGAAGNAVCARLERVEQEGKTGPIHVEREAVCLDAGSGAVLLRRSLPRRGLYTMHEDLAVGGSPPVLAFARPEADGLHIDRIALGAKDGTEVAR